MIEIVGVRHRTLDIPSLILRKGTTALIGPNGAGKSTLLQLCAGVEEPERGSVRIDGISPRRVKIGWVDENPERTLLFEIVYDELASSLRFQHVPCPEVRTRVTADAERLRIRHLLFCRTHELSAGEKVLVALGAAMIGRPEALILDECDSHLDPATETLVKEKVRESTPQYLLLSTQQMETAAEADQVVYLEEGHPIYTGTPREVFKHLKESCFYPLSWRTTDENTP
ncbi:MAG: energy-coupling factor ABC transporter ATP-binding protein [Methanomicrobiales archaeon]|nr:energy-coupling factor ABC transporter ATP-binding protein [Methanomicrobiales archaeon]